MNAEKLAKMQAQVRMGGKGTARRKKKVVHKTAATDDKKLQSSLKKISVNQIPGIEEVNMIKDDGTVMHFNNPKVQASLASNTFAVAGHAENKQITELLPGILNQLGAESLSHLRKLAGGVGGLGSTDSAAANDADDEDDDVPDLVENFDEASKNEVPNATPKEDGTLSATDLSSSRENSIHDDEGEAITSNINAPGEGKQTKSNENSADDVLVTSANSHENSVKVELTSNGNERDKSDISNNCASDEGKVEE